MTADVDHSRDPAQTSAPAPLPTRWLTSAWLLLLVVWLTFFWQLGGPPLYDLDEGAFT
ncbi:MULTISPECIES: hypothetical protein [Thiorhodovibrio]|uniref:hypothetical protein n=1 Tax=Thiorhodovibrio TaxID=61593 RepID=UPI0019130A42|nr:hypothetical protein Thiosp_02166 [Thiorhodovibrio litoralis]